MKTKDILFLNEILSLPTTRLTKIHDDEAKFKIILMLPELKAIAEKYHNLVEGAREKLQDEKYDEYDKRLKEWQKKGDDAFSKEEKDDIANYFNETQKSFNKFVEAENEKEIELDTTAIKDNIRGIILSNDFVLADVQRLMEIL